MKNIATALCLACLLLASLLVAPAHSAGYILSLQDENGRQLFSTPLQENASFAIRYMHSVALTPVTDYFIIKDGKIYLDKTIYQDFGAGLPHEPEAGQQMKTQNGHLSITGFNREIPELGLRVGRVANHRLLLFMENGDDRDVATPLEVPLAGLSPPGAVIMFRVLKGT